MPRQARVTGQYCTYHIMLRGNEKKDIFNSGADKYKFLEFLSKTKTKYDIKIYAYCLMNNHVHLLLSDNGSNISQIMKSLSISYVQSYNRKHSRSGHLFQDRFKSELIQDDQYLLQASKYIHNNPVKAGMTTKPLDYQWSSYRIYLGLVKDELGIIDTDLILDCLSTNRGAAIKAYKIFVANEEEMPFQFIDIDEGLAKTEHKQNFIWSKAEASERVRAMLEIKNQSYEDMQQNKQLRDGFIRLIRKSSALTLKEIGEVFGSLSESQVSRIVGK